MSPEAATFEPSPLSGPRTATVDDHRTRAAGYAAGWAAGARAAAEQATALRRRLEEEQAEAEAVRAAEHAALVAALERACAAAAARTAPVLVDAQRRLQSAALELAETLIGAELSDGERSARVALDRALAVPPELGLHTIRLSPADAHRIQVAVDEGGATLPEGVMVLADPSLTPGDAISVHETGYLDARLGAAVARVREIVAGQGL